jgi:hypothetical protein
MKRIHVPTKTVFQTDKDAYQRGEWSYRVQSGGKAEPIDTINWIVPWNIHLYEVIDFDSATHKRTNVLIESGGVYSYRIDALTQQELDDRAVVKLEADLQQATISSAILITEVFTVLNQEGVIDASQLSDKAKVEFATLVALVAQYNP